MLYIILSRFYASFTPIGFYDDKAEAEALVTTVAGETYIHEDISLTWNGQKEIYTAMEGVHRLYMASFDKTEIENYVNKYDSLNMQAYPVNEPILECVKDYVVTNKRLNLQPMTFDMETGETIVSFLQNV